MTNKKDNAVTYCEALTFNASKKSLTPILIGGEPYFIANEVCEILEISNSRDAVGRLDSDEKLTSVMSTSGQNRQVNLVNESGLYSLIFQSRKPQAKIFRKWVTSEVLPAIRKTGNYESKQRNNPCELADLLANAALVLGSYRALAKEIGVSESVISELRSNKRKHSETMTEHIIIACRHIVSDDSSISYVMSKIKFRTGQEKNNRLIKALALLCHVPDNDLRTSIANELTGGLV